MVYTIPYPNKAYSLYTKAPIYPERRWLDELGSVDATGRVDVLEGQDWE